MKTQKIISIKSVSAVMLVATLLAFAACSSEDGNSTNEKEQPSASKTQIKPPAMDIHTATFMGDLKAIQKHIAAGSDLDEKDEYGSTPLTITATFGKTEVARALIEAGADVNIQNNEGSTPLHTAAFLCRTEIVEMLMSNGADKDVKNNFGHTALETVTGPFESVKGIYDQISKDLGPLGLKLDSEYIEMTRPVIAEMLR